MENAMEVVQQIMVMLPTIVAIGWSVEKILRLLNQITPAGWTWDDNLADVLGKLLKALAGLSKKKDI